MVGSYTHTTALKIYTAIAQSAENGVDIDQLTAATGMAGNTLRSYARWLQEDGAIEIAGIHSDAPNRPLKNLYLAIREPRERVTEQERLRAIAEILEPFSKHPDRWDKAYKGEIIHAIEQAIRLC